MHRAEEHRRETKMKRYTEEQIIEYKRGVEHREGGHDEEIQRGVQQFEKYEVVCEV